MRWELGRSVREVAQSLGISVGVICKAVQRAKVAGLD
jgi:transposase